MDETQVPSPESPIPMMGQAQTQRESPGSRPWLPETEEAMSVSPDEYGGATRRKGKARLSIATSSKTSEEEGQPPRKRSTSEVRSGIEGLKVRSPVLQMTSLSNRSRALQQQPHSPDTLLPDASDFELRKSFLLAQYAKHRREAWEEQSKKYVAGQSAAKSRQMADEYKQQHDAAVMAKEEQDITVARKQALVEQLSEKKAKLRLLQEGIAKDEVEVSALVLKLEDLRKIIDGESSTTEAALQTPRLRRRLCPPLIDTDVVAGPSGSSRALIKTKRHQISLQAHGPEDREIQPSAMKPTSPSMKRKLIDKRLAPRKVADSSAPADRNPPSIVKERGNAPKTATNVSTSKAPVVPVTGPDPSDVDYSSFKVKLKDRSSAMRKELVSVKKKPEGNSKDRALDK